MSAIGSTGTQFLEGFVQGAAQGLSQGMGIQQTVDLAVRSGLAQCLSAVPGLNKMMQSLESLLPQMQPFGSGVSGPGQGVAGKLQQMLGGATNDMLGAVLNAALGPLAGGMAMDAMGGNPMGLLQGGGGGGYGGGMPGAGMMNPMAMEMAGQAALQKLLGDSGQGGYGMPGAPSASGGGLPQGGIAAEKTLRDNFSKLQGKDGLVSLQTINDIAVGGKCPDGSEPSPELRQACQQLRNDPSRFHALETAHHGGGGDMKIGMGDLDTVIKKHSPQQQLLDNFDHLKTKDGLITLQTINEIASGGKCPDGTEPSPALRKACQQMRDNPQMFASTETAKQGDLGKADMLISASDLKTTLKV